MAAALMAVPEAAMHEHYSAIFREHEIWAYPQQSGVEAVAQSGSVEKASETQLWSGMSSVYARHHPRAGLAIDDVHHYGQPAAVSSGTAGDPTRRSAARPTVKPRIGGTASPIHFARFFRVYGRPPGAKSNQSGKPWIRAASCGVMGWRLR
jgi:hypothetical protein